MLNMFRASRYNVLVWALLALLIVGLAGFGIGAGGVGGASVARVGGERVEAEAYARALDQELRAFAQQIGRQLPMSEARQFGVDRIVLARLVSDATLDDEADRLGLSAGDATVREMVMATPAFQGTDGAFDPEAYAFALERGGLTPAEFEALLREEATRETIASSLQSAVVLPDSAADTLLAFAGERRRFDWLELDASLLAEPAPAPGDGELEAFYGANAARYTRPETRRITYALLDPAALAQTIEVSEEEIAAAYAAAGERFDRPEWRIADRIGFATTEEAAAALARIEAGEIDFDALAAERGLSAAAIDQGSLAADDLEAEAAAAVFGAGEPGIVGPVDTPLGPSLYRVNAIIAAAVTPLEEAREELRRELALEKARAQAAEAAAPAEDLLAGGARLEEIAEETAFELGTLSLDAATTGGLADDPAFRELAEGAEIGVETDLAELASGALVTLRVDAIEPPTVIPLAEIRERVAADWTAEENARRLEAMAEALKAELEAGLPFADLAARLGRPVQAAGPATRGEADHEDEHEGAEAPAWLIEPVFAAEPGGVATVSEDGRVALAQVTEVIPFSEETAEAGVVEQVEGQLRTQAADDMLALYLQALQNDRGVTLNQQAVEGVLTQFP